MIKNLPMSMLGPAARICAVMEVRLRSMIAGDVAAGRFAELAPALKSASRSARAG